MNRWLEEEMHRVMIEKNRPPHRTVYTPGEDPEEFGRRAARDLWDRYIKDAVSTTAQSEKR
ncbi:MAG: hypothetical protein OXD34_07175 [bacterium]|nr:hypothetical protein [bacterium]